MQPVHAVALIGFASTVLLAVHTLPGRDQAREVNFGPLAASIGGARDLSGGPALSRIRQVLPLGEDEILVTDWQSSQVMMYQATGRFARVFARSGSGPGEFQAVGRMGVIGDTIWVVDTRRRVRNLFGRSGQVVRGIPLPRVSRPVGANTPPAFAGQTIDGGFLTTGNAVAFLATTLPMTGQPSRDGREGNLVLVDTGGRVVDTLSAITAALPYLRLHVGPLLHQLEPNQLQRLPLWHVAENGTSFILLDRKHDIRNARERSAYSVRAWDAQGRSSFDTTIDYQPVPVPPAVVDSLIRVYAREMRLNDPSLRNAETLIRDSLRIPSHFPAASALLLGTDGRIWIAKDGLEGRSGSQARNYDVLDQQGQLVGRARLPRAGTLVAATKLSIWILDYDADDVPTLYRFPLTP